jgi:hypothetical protein
MALGPVPQAAEPQPPILAYDPTTYAPKAAPKTDPWTDAEIKSKFNALQGDPEIERRIPEFKEGRRIAAELEADERKREKDRGRESPAPPEEGKE